MLALLPAVQRWTEGGPPWSYDAVVFRMREERLIASSLPDYTVHRVLDRALLRGLLDWDAVLPGGPALAIPPAAPGHECWIRSHALGHWMQAYAPQAAAAGVQLAWTSNHWSPHQVRAAAIRLTPVIAAGREAFVAYAADYVPHLHRTPRRLRRLLRRMIQVRICWDKFTFEHQKLWKPEGLAPALFDDPIRLQRAGWAAKRVSAATGKDVKALLRFRVAGLSRTQVHRFGTAELCQLPPSRLIKLAHSCLP